MNAQQIAAAERLANGQSMNGDGSQAEPSASAEPLTIEVDTIEEFAAVEEDGAQALIGDSDSVLIPEGGDVMIYGDGGAGKTTLALDAACHLGAGADWLGMPVSRPMHVLVVEAEGPRPLLRAKLRRKLVGWGGPPIAGRVHVLSTPWASFTFASEQWRAELARIVAEYEVEVVMVGPLTRIGMNTAGTLQEVVEFMALVEDVRSRCGRRLCVLLIHHENKGGSVSGAWEGAGDTLLHVQEAGHGHTVVYIQKARWDSERHGTTLKLKWTEVGEGFEVEDERDLMAIARGLFADGKWRTLNEIKTAIEVGKETLQKLITDHPDEWLGPRTGDEARALGRSSTSKLYMVASCLA